MKGFEIASIAESLAFRTPAIIVAIVALVMAVQRRDRYPRASNYVMIAGIGMLVQSLVSFLFYLLVPKMELHGEGAAYIYRGAGCCFNIFDALFTGLLVAAAFVERRDPNGPPSRLRRERLDEPTVVDDDLSRRATDQGPPNTGFRDRPGG